MATAVKDDPELWDDVKSEVINKRVAGTASGQWSARKAQLAVRLYKQRGGGYIGSKSNNNDLVKWSRQDWRTKSGKPSSETGERYLPAKAIKALTPAEYGATTKAKREGTKKGKQFVPQPEKISVMVRKYRDE